MTKLFGTDGVRGTANSHPMTAEMVLRIGAAVGRYFRQDDKGVHRVVIGKDTRLSGYMFENALTAGLTSTNRLLRTAAFEGEVGVDVLALPIGDPKTSGAVVCRNTDRKE